MTNWSAMACSSPFALERRRRGLFALAPAAQRYVPLRDLHGGGSLKPPAV